MEPNEPPITDETWANKLKSEYFDEQKALQLERLSGRVDKKFEYLVKDRLDWKSEYMNLDEQMERYTPDPSIEPGTGDFQENFLEKGVLTGKEFKTISPALVKDVITDLLKATPIFGATSNLIDYEGCAWVIMTCYDPGDASRIMYGLCEATAYEDSVLATKHILRSPQVFRSTIFDWHDLYSNEEVDAPGKSSTYFYAINNLDSTPTSHTYYWYIRYRYLGRYSKGGT